MADPAAFTWDVRLALQLLAHTGKMTSAGGQSCKSEFWEKYLDLLPDPSSLCQPFCLSPSTLDEFQHSSLKAGAMAQQERLRMLLPDMMPPQDAPETAFPSVLQWAFACVRSRAFVVESKSPEDRKEAETSRDGAGGATEKTTEAAGGDTTADNGRESTRRFQPSAAAVAEAKAAAKKSGGFAMLIPGSGAGQSLPPLVAEGENLVTS